jgi:lysophospholipase L1-like esterase
MANPYKPPLRILCFGDSLTEGYNNYGLSMDPYSSTMKELLEARIGDEYEIEVETDGVSGELVTGGGFEGRMRSWCEFVLSLFTINKTLLSFFKLYLEKFLVASVVI